LLLLANQIQNTIVVASGKGGVGKSTTAGKLNILLIALTWAGLQVRGQ